MRLLKYPKRIPVKFTTGIRTLRTLLLLVPALLAMPLWAQLDNVMVYGTVKDMSTAKKLDGVTITVFKNGSKLMDAMSNASGKYEVSLDYGAEFKVQCSKPGFIGKNITIDTRNIPEEERLGGHGMNIDFTMMAEIQGVDYSILNEPFGKAKYVSASGNFEWDMEYTARMRDAQARLLKEYEDRKKREGNAEAEYAKAMEQGVAAMTAKDFKKAIASFTTALEMKPADPMATAKLSDARMQMESLEGERKLEEQYAALIKEADALFTKKSYPEAKAKYDAASDLKMAEAYPKQRIREIDTILEELAKKAEEERKAKELLAKYQAAITAADAAMKAEKWDDATAKYTEASGLKPEEQYPKDQLAYIATKKAEAAKKAEEERLAKELLAKYQAAITAADAAFKGKKWDDATAKYNEALALKPEEKYPKDQLAAILVQKDEAAKKAEEERLAKELQAKYQAAITEADAAFKSASYEVATTKYNEASTLKPAEQYPKDQLVAIRKKLDELAKKAEEELKAKEIDARYQALVSEADAAFAAERWDDAIGKYTEAGTVKPAEKYPKDQLTAIQKKKDELAKKAEDEKKQRELDERYQAALTAADAAFGKEEWDAAKAKYTEAAVMKPTERYPKDQITAIAQRIAEAEARKKEEELKARYDGIVAAADAAFAKEEFAAAKTKYQEALQVKPTEKYPKDRIAAADAAIAALAAKAEEERKAKELAARYTELIARADKAFDGEQWSAALNDYKDALQLKPEEVHPKTRIRAIEQKMDAAAQAKAEEERLLREAQERDKRYTDLVTAADKAFGGKDYTAAESKYKEALEVKAGEAHPTARLVEIARIQEELMGKAEAERLAAEREAAERARKAEEDRLAAEAAAAEKARLEEEERLRRSSLAEQDARYREMVSAGDEAFKTKDYDLARNRFQAALGVKPQESYPKERIAAIEQAIAADADAERMAAERRRAEEERLRKEQEAAEAARLAEMSDRQRAEEERLRKEQEEAEARRAEEERERMLREGSKALEERYRNAIVSADESLAAKDYERARGLYAEASDLKPSETYPLSKIDQIDKTLAELERLRAEAELAAQRAAQARSEEQPRQNTTIDIRKEQEAEQFMREAREREEAEKYERIKKMRAELDREEAENAGTAAERRDGAVAQKQRYQEGDAQLYEGDESRRERNAQELIAYQEALQQTEQERVQRAAEVRDGNYGNKIATEEAVADRQKTWDELHAQRTEEMVTAKDDLSTAEAARVEAGREQTERNKAALDGVATQTMTMEQRSAALVEEKRRAVEAEKRAQQAHEANYVRQSEQARMGNQEKLQSVQTGQPRTAAEFNRSKLAQDYPPGVTEESYTEGNKVIIRRVVVNGNRADEYSKVIAKWGTFYFKNGQSITESIWSRETEG
jgi:hypothetical protein